LLSQKQVLGFHGAPRPARQHDESKKIHKDAERRPNQVAKRLQPIIQGAHERSGSHARTTVTATAARLRGLFAHHGLAGIEAERIIERRECDEVVRPACEDAERSVYPTRKMR
jgi:hypothetical protein